MSTVNRFRKGSGFIREGYRILLVGLFVAAVVTGAGPAWAVDISDRPLDVEFRAASTTVMFVLDDSGSMDWEFMTDESGGLFSDNRYIYPVNPGDNVYTSSSYYMNDTERGMWLSQWFGYNKLYYNPRSVYSPWPSNTAFGILPDADVVNPRSNPMNASATLPLNGTYLSVQKQNTEGESHERIMNQRGPDNSTTETNCGTWVVVGEYDLDHTQTWQVTIEREGTTGSSTVSGAVKFKNTVDNTEVIIDDEDGEPQYKEYGNWSNSGFGPSYQGITRYTSTVGDRAEYTPTLASSGRYEISVWWSCYNARDLEAKVTVERKGPQVEIRNSHYYLLDDVNGNGTADSGEGIYLVNMNGSSRSYYRFDDGNGNGRVEDLELVEIQRADIPESVRPPGVAVNGLMLPDAESVAAAGAADLQNFANWYSFYRKRELTAKAAVARTIAGIEGLKVGFFSINKNLKQEALPVKVARSDGTVDDNTPALLTALYGLNSSGGTPLREGLDEVGKYYSGSSSYFSSDPYGTEDNGGACQRVYAIAMTDGYWTENNISIGDQDGDTFEHTLADVAMKYYKNDLRDDLSNNVPPSVCGSLSVVQSHQHMVTFSVSFGVFGNLNPDEYDACTLKNADGESPPWSTPFCNDCSSKIDDLWHAAANTRGEFFSASNPESLVNSLKDIFIEIEARELSGASVAVSAEKLYTESIMYEGSYLSANWTGDIKAYGLAYNSASKAIEINQVPVWSAAGELNKSSVTWDSRNIITNEGATGKTFRWSALSAVQRAHLDNNEYILKYLRGFRLSDAVDAADKAGLQLFRVRDSRLGDIVNSSPVKIGDSLYVGANDGMLHVLNATDGTERFAYVPNLVFHNLKALTESGYQHKFYVDQTPVYSYIGVGDNAQTYLVGGLQKGGKGYYCLNVTGVDTMEMTESNIAGLFKWEFSDSTDLGYTFSNPVITRTKSAEHKYVVVFGNGYNSANGHAVLFVVDLFTGSLIKKIDTLAGGDNGLSSSIAIDVNNDWAVDYVYGGDLNGNLWKFDLSSEDHNQWAVAFADKSTGQPAPLFKTAAGQPITSQPDVMRHSSGKGTLVAFGTGKFLGMSDLADTTTQAIYGIWDYGDDEDDGEFPGTFNKTDLSVSMHPDRAGVEVRLLEQEVLKTEASGDSITRTTTDRNADWSVVDDHRDSNANQTPVVGQMPNPIKNIGWFLELGTLKERVYQNVFIQSGALVVLSLIPVPDACSGGGYSMIYTLDPGDGGQLGPAWTYQNEKLEEPTTINWDPPSDDGEDSGKKMMLFSHKVAPKPLETPDIDAGTFFWREVY